ncbi:Hypothetical protein R9X50_00162400 [Acrodontium crateriforme]|uniref:Uncharacterized protein n=1 Tax=Acrodontium crateriforme TaxID=150365 RepID=A0AAQ3LZC0_9PEZI|nr:Hypothetical protein R9X50_00162400 [Acrodontium crateriforme]
MRGLIYRITLFTINILFPPLSVLLLCGPNWDLVLNCSLFLLAIIPSHIHGLYISCTYFHRRRKVKKGVYPGGSKPMIKSKNVINGGASDVEVERLYLKTFGRDAASRRYSHPQGYSRYSDTSYGAGDGSRKYYS